MSALPFAIDANGAASPLYSHINESDVLPPVKRLMFAQYVPNEYSDPFHIGQKFHYDAEAAALEVGVKLPEQPIYDGSFHYAESAEGKNDQRQGYIGELTAGSDGAIVPTMTIRSFRGGEKVAYWSPRDLLFQEYMAYKKGAPMPPSFNPEEYSVRAAALAEEHTKKREQRERLDLAGRAFVAQSASRAWEAAQPDTEHPYLTRKGIAAAGARVATSELEGALYDQAKGEIFPNGELCKKGELLIPVYNAGGELVNIQRISKDGKSKLPLKGGEMKGCFYRLEGTTPAFVVEGFADAATVSAATGRAVYVAFSAYNLKHVCSTQLDIGAVAADDGEAGTKAAEATGLPYLAPPNPHGVSGYDWNDYGTANGLDAVREALNALTPVERKPAIANGWDLADEAEAPLFLIDDLLEEDAHGILGGASMTYKSFFALRMAHSICSGDAFMGRKVHKPGAVVYVCGEGQGAVRRRLKALKLHLGGNPKHPIHLVGDSVNLNSAESMAALGQTLSKIQPVLVIFDTFASLAGGIEENSNSEVGNALNLVRDTCRAAGASSLIVHHFGKDSDRGFRGASAFVNNVDFAFSAKRINKGAAEVACEKMKDGEHFSPIAFTAEVIPLGIYDQNGKETTSLVIRQAERGAIAGNDQDTEGTYADRAYAALVRVYDRQVAQLAKSGRHGATPFVLMMDWRLEVEKLDLGAKLNLTREAAKLAERGRIEKLSTGAKGGEFRPIIEDDI